MKYYPFLFLIYLLCWGDICFAQRSVKPARARIGISSNHIFTSEYLTNTIGETRNIYPLRSSIGVQIGAELSEKWSVGASVYYRYWTGKYIIPYGYGIMFVPPQNRIIETKRHTGGLDLYMRRYAQGPRSPSRMFVQAGLNTSLIYFERWRHPFHWNTDKRAWNTYPPHPNGLGLSLGGGVQYRFARYWMLETLALINWSANLRDLPLNKIDFGVQLGLYKAIF